MKDDQGLSETVSVILIIGMVLVLSVVIVVLVLGVNIIPQNPAYIAVDIQKTLVNGNEVISIFNRAGDTASLKNITDQQQYVLYFYVDTTSGSYRVQPPSGQDTFSPGTTLFVYNTSTGIYKITNNSADLVSAFPPISLTSVRLVDENSHQLIAQWRNSTGGSSGGTSALPTVTGISPVTGSTLGGTIVTITGTNLLGAAAGGANGVTFGGAAATGVSVVSGTSVTATTSSHAAGAVDVVVTTPNGTVTGTTGAYTYVDPPTFGSITPTSGPTDGGTAVTISGTNFIGATGVTFDSIAATSFSVDNANQITTSTPGHVALGVVNVVVTTPNGTATGAYTYVAPPAFVSAATNAAGTVINITFDKNMAALPAEPAGFTVTVNGGANVVSAVALNADNKIIELTLTTPVASSTDVITVTYAPGTVKSVDGGVLAGFGPTSVTNNKPAIPITAIGTITGTPQVGSLLTAGALTPSGATASYQWLRSTTSGGTYTAISGATSSTYTPVAGDIGYYIEVAATGTGSYTGTITSAYVGPVTSQLTGIGPITGSVQVGSLLTAGALTPSGATANYQWQRSTTSGGTYTAISGATSSTYTPIAGDIGYYIEVAATGTGSYTGIVTSAEVGPVPAIPLTAIGAITGTPQVGSVLTAGALTPSGATASYQWSRSTTSGGTYTAISGATSSTYTPVAGDIGYYIEVAATGTGSYIGTVTSAYVGSVTAIPLTGIGPITGTVQVGSLLTAGTLTPSGATASYQWQRSTTSGGTYTAISGATSSTYIPVAGDTGYYIEVAATGTGSYTGIVTSAYVGSVPAIPLTAIGAISGTVQVGSALTAGTLTPSSATASYQWQRSTTAGGTYTAISGATASTYTPVAGDVTYYIRVVATGTGSYTGTVTSAYVGSVPAIPLTAIGAISGTVQVGSALTAGTLTPSGATASYQWSRSTTSGGTYTPISGATTTTYTPVAGDVTYYIRVVATGTGSYSGTVTSAYVGPVTRAPIAIGAISGTPKVGSALTAGALTPSGATASYQWSRSTTSGGTYTAISGATTTTYTPVTGDTGYYIRVVATGTGGYTGTATSAGVGPVQSTPTITSLSKTTGAHGSTVANIQINGVNYITSPVPTVIFTQGANTMTATVTAVTTTRVTVSLVISTGQPTGAYSVTVTNTDGGTVTRANSFTVT